MSDKQPPIKDVTKPFNGVVKVMLPTVESVRSQSQALITDANGEIREMVPAERVKHRMKAGETYAYFNARIKGRIGVLELGERAETPAKEW